MIKAFKKELPDYNVIKVIDLETGDYSSYHQEKSIGFPFGIPHKTTVFKMGYKSVEECLKALKERNFLGYEVDYKEQKETERIGFIRLGAERIRRAERINTNDFEDIVETLSSYGMGFCDAQNCIIATYLNEIQPQEA
jgi:hypothetical protein